MTNEVLNALKPLVEKCAMELVFAEPGQAARLEPLQDCLSRIEALPIAVSVPLSIPEVLLADAIGRARQWVNDLLEAGQWDAPTLRCLSEWANWMQSACSALETGANLPLLPETWNEPVAAEIAPSAASPARPDEPEPPLQLNLETDGELLGEFITESHEHLQNIEQGVLTLEENPRDLETLNSIFRAFHTFKGVSGFLNLSPINHLAHELESLLDQARQHKLIIDSEVINIILKGGDLLSQFVTEIEARLGGQKSGVPIDVPTRPLLARIRAVMAREQPPQAPPPELPAAPESLFADLAAPLVSRAAAENYAGAPMVPALPPASAGPGESKARQAISASSVKVDTQKLDNLVDLVGEMVIAQSMVEQDKDLREVQSQQLSRNMAQLGRITKELQRVAMSLRMVPVRSTFRKMTRPVRDLALRAGKQVELVMSGEETELDRTIVEEISDPLVHMIRNAVDHGIEKPEARRAAGKPAQGTISLRAFHQGGSIVLEISDNGQGLNQERILAKAVEKGLVQPDAQLSEKEIFDLVFAPGFSTAEQITDISGRGVGMDVVRQNIEKLGGSIKILSTPGQGATFTLYLPLTLAIIDGLIAKVGRERFILPTLAIRESFRPAAKMITTIHERSEMVNVRGRLLPLLRLHEYFNIEPQSADPAQSIVIVVEADNESRCLLVDELLGKQEVVIKSLGEAFKHSRSIAGAAILGDGRVGLILDISSLVKLRPTGSAKAA